MHLNLKVIACKWCGRIGCLVLHGFLKGYEEASQDKFNRAHRILCSSRRKRGDKGCGKTFSVYFASVITNVRISAESLWKFLSAVAGGEQKIKVFRSLLPQCFHDRSIHRWWQRFVRIRQSAIRSLLCTICPPPVIENRSPEIQTILHLEKAFSSCACPVAAFHLLFQCPFL